ncbi:asparaginase [Alkalihalobacillus sp. LMS39]|uniref:asparaginase n=1 Tax=Alkalihalobacillus sp. LMS39 TaxID=2924032 RepID=UPI001FB22E29|nr:asparaginase [Alkalihalobacillus sp. LMS39]UOE92369.1 asparaginase [Alkalihalobacillus sp. LMS39]
MKKVLVIQTGGTIAMQEDESTGVVQPNVVNPLYSTIESLSSIASVVVDDFINLPSPHITPTHMFSLYHRIQSRITSENFDGVVVTHGTDTLEETAYFLDLLMNQQIAVVVTGAMRSSNELGSDGPHNLISAVRTVVSPEASDKGVLVVLNDEIHTAKNVTKTHSSNIATFQSPQYGPIGIVTKKGVSFHHMPVARDCYAIQSVTKNVALIKMYAGMDPTLVEAIANTNVDGLVIEAFGQGNVPPQIVPMLQSMIEKGTPIVLVSRCFNGIVQDTYGYEGGGHHLKQIGVIFTNGLTGQKARLKLMIALETTTDHTKLQSLFLQ